MFEELETGDRKDEKDKVSVGEALGVYVLLLTVACGSLLAFISLEDLPFGIQLASVLSYSACVFVYTFFRTRGINTRHNLGDPYVQRMLPRIFALHCGYLLAMVAGELLALSIRGTLPVWWTAATRQGDMAPLTVVQFAVIGMMAISEVVLCRFLLARSKKQQTASSMVGEL